MTVPTRPLQPEMPVLTATSTGELYEVTLQDGTVLWIPKNDNNNDCVKIEAWADASNIDL